MRRKGRRRHQAFAPVHQRTPVKKSCVWAAGQPSQPQAAATPSAQGPVSPPGAGPSHLFCFITHTGVAVQCRHSCLPTHFPSVYCMPCHRTGPALYPWAGSHFGFHPQCQHIFRVLTHRVLTFFRSPLSPFHVLSLARRRCRVAIVASATWVRLHGALTKGPVCPTMQHCFGSLFLVHTQTSACT